MRSDKEIFDLILSAAESDDRILAAYLKGSRTNPKVPKDQYRDFDVMYVVKETKSFLEDISWLKPFGKVILLQEQDSDFGYGDRFGLRKDFHQLYSWLLLFEDGIRIDLGIETISNMKKGYCRNKLFLPLLDKIHCLPRLPAPSDEDYHVKPPSEKRFQGCCNEFFWSLCDVSKGIARDELPFAMSTYNTLSHSMLEQMLEWYIGCQTGFSVSCGKQNKFFKNYLSEELYTLFVRTYSDGCYPHLWSSIDTSCRLFHRAASSVADFFSYQYPQEDEDGFFQYLSFIKNSI